MKRREVLDQAGEPLTLFASALGQAIVWNGSAWVNQAITPAVVQEWVEVKWPGYVPKTLGEPLRIKSMWVARLAHLEAERKECERACVADPASTDAWERYRFACGEVRFAREQAVTDQFADR